MLKTYKSKKIIIGKMGHRKMPQTNLRKNLRDYKTAFCSPLAHTVLQKKICKDLTMFLGFWPMFDLKMKVKVKYYD
jgi:hypothetical protein